MRCDGRIVRARRLLLPALTLPVALLLPARAAAQPPEGRRFVGYTPSRCAIAAQMIDGINRHDRRDTTVYTPARDTLFTATVESLRECERAYGGTTSDPRERLNVARVQLFTGQDEAAAATQGAHMASMADRPAEERAWELLLIVQDILAGKPARLERARAVLAELDALGKAAASVRTVAHYLMMQEAIERSDDEWMRQEAAAVVKAWQELDEATREFRSFWLMRSIRDRAAVEALAHGRDAALVVLDSAKGLIPSGWSAREEISRLERMYAVMGKVGAPFEARFWYNTGETRPRRPAPGRVSLALTLVRPCTDVTGCLPMVEAARRIAARFQGQDLDITFRTRTLGFYADTAPATPLAEAQYDSAYFLHHVKIPGALAVAETKFSFRMDGRRVNEPTTDDLNYPGPWQGAGVIVVDRKGVVRYVAASWWHPVLETRISSLIEQLLQETADTTGTGAAPDPAGSPAHPDGPSPGGGPAGDAVKHATAARGPTQQRRTSMDSASRSREILRRRPLSPEAIHVHPLPRRTRGGPRRRLRLLRRP